VNYVGLLVSIIIFSVSAILILAACLEYRREARIEKIMKEILKHKDKLYTNRLR
jgi:hypothetical protein